MRLLNANILKVGLKIITDDEPVTIISINKHKIKYNNKIYCVEFEEYEKFNRLLTIEDAIQFCIKKDNIINYDRFRYRSEIWEFVKKNKNN